MKAQMKFTLILGVLTIASMAAGVVFDYDGVSYMGSELEPFDGEIKPRSTQKRTWKEVSYENVLEIAGAGDQLLYNPVIVKTTHAGDIYILDLGDMSVKRFTADGAPVATYGGQKGQGPGEFINPTDFFVDADGKVWICDPPNGVLAVFAPDTTLLETIRMEMNPYRILRASPESLLYVAQNPGDDLFTVSDMKGGDTVRFGRFIEGQAKKWLALDGTIVDSENDGFVFAPLYGAFLASYSYSGDLRYLVETVDATGLPRIVTNNDGKMWVDRNAPRRALSASVDDKKIYVFNTYNDDLEVIRIVDVYDNEDGAYLFSMRAPEQSRRLYAAGGHIYTVMKGLVTKWKPVSFG